MRCSTSSGRSLPDAAWNQSPTRASMQRRYELVSMRRIAARMIFLLATLLAFAAQAPDAAYLQSFEKWKADLIADRKARWLPLAGLFWLKPGANTFGSA